MNQPAAPIQVYNRLASDALGAMGSHETNRLTNQNRVIAAIAAAVPNKGLTTKAARTPCFHIRVIAISQPRLEAIATRTMQHSDACITTSPKLSQPKAAFRAWLFNGADCLDRRGGSLSGLGWRAHA